MVNSVLMNTSTFNITCGDADTPFQTYTYSVASTPVIHSVTQTATVGDRIDIVLSGLSDVAEDNVFVFGVPVTCISSNFSSRTEPLNSTATIMRTYLLTSEIQCTLSDMSPGTYRTVLHVAGRGWGYASLESSVICIKPRIDSVSVTSGSLRGGTSLDIQMTGLSPSNIAKTRVHIGNTPCLVQSISNRGQLTCTTKASVDDGYSSLVNQDSPLAYWSLQADYYRSNGSYLGSEGEHWFRSGGTLGVRANASTFGTVTTRQTGISGNAGTDQSAFFEASYIQVPVLSEFSDAGGFAMDLWIKAPQISEDYQIVVDSSSFADGVASGFLLVLNPCDQLEFWLATGVPLQNYMTDSSSECELIANATHCSQFCNGYLNVPESENLPSGIWNVIRAEYMNLSSWQYVHFGWTADDNTTLENCSSPDQCGGLQVLYINNIHTEQTTTYFPSINTPIGIGGSNVPHTSHSNQALGSFVGYLDEVAFYERPLDSEQVQTHVQYGTTESQPIWVSVNGVDGIGQGSVPNVVYQEVDQGFTNDTVVNWDLAQELRLEIEESTIIRFEWTGYGPHLI